MKTNDYIQKIGINDGIVNGNFIPAYTNCWEMTSVNIDGSTVFRGVWNDRVTFYKVGKREVLKRKQHIQYLDKSTIQEEEVYRDNLEHIRLTIFNVGEKPSTDIQYDSGRIWGVKVFRIEGLDEIEQISLPFSYQLGESVFDWHLWGILIAGFPLKEDYAAKFLAHESYSYFPGDFRWITLKVKGVEVIDAGKWGMINCYIVEVKAEVKWKFWISIDKTKAPVQQICIYHTSEVQLWWKPSKNHETTNH